MLFMCYRVLINRFRISFYEATEQRCGIIVCLACLGPQVVAGKPFCLRGHKVKLFCLPRERQFPPEHVEVSRDSTIALARSSFLSFAFS